ncbi:MAG: hypothetical protein NVS2B9_00980 [Myxococcales bacterium]
MPALARVDLVSVRPIPAHRRLNREAKQFAEPRARRAFPAPGTRLRLLSGPIALPIAHSVAPLFDSEIHVWDESSSTQVHELAQRRDESLRFDLVADADSWGRLVPFSAA